MGVLIGDSAENSTWGKNRTPIFSTYLGISSDSGNHNLVASDGWAAESGSFFRCAQWWEFTFWTDSGGTSQTGWLGPFAFPGSPFPLLSVFYVGAYNTDPAEPYAPNFLDDDEVQAVWVGRDVVIDSFTYSMSYSALNGVTGSSQSITPSADVISFDL